MSEQQPLYDVIGHISQYDIQVESHTTGRDVTHIPERKVALDAHLPCPFCGQPPDPELGAHDDRMYWVECTSGFVLCIGGPSRSTPEAAWEAWDNRAAADVTALVTEVLDGIEQEWVDQRVEVIQNILGGAWPADEDGIKADVVKRMAAFRTYLASKLAAVRVGHD